MSYFENRGSEELPGKTEDVVKKAVSIEIDRWEGTETQVGAQTVTGLKVWQKANNVLFAIALTVEGGYDKCGFTVTFDDGDTYEGRIDVYPCGEGKNETLEEHIRLHCLFHTGQASAPWMGKKRYREFLKAVVKPAQHEALMAILETYKLGDDLEEVSAQEAWIKAMGG